MKCPSCGYTDELPACESCGKPCEPGDLYDVTIRGTVEHVACKTARTAQPAEAEAA